jgi:hypothetical protein
VERPFSKKKYHVRESRVAGQRPARLKRKNFGMPELSGPSYNELHALDRRRW